MKKLSFSFILSLVLTCGVVCTVKANNDLITCTSELRSNIAGCTWDTDFYSWGETPPLGPYESNILRLNFSDSKVPSNTRVRFGRAVYNMKKVNQIYRKISDQYPCISQPPFGPPASCFDYEVDDSAPECSNALESEDFVCPSTKAFVASCVDLGQESEARKVFKGAYTCNCTNRGCSTCQFLTSAASNGAEVISGCDPSTYYTKIIEEHGEVFEGGACDLAGNCAGCTASPEAKIDCTPPGTCSAIGQTIWTNPVTNTTTVVNLGESAPLGYTQVGECTCAEMPDNADCKAPECDIENPVFPACCKNDAFANHLECTDDLPVACDPFNLDVANCCDDYSNHPDCSTCQGTAPGQDGCTCDHFPDHVSCQNTCVGSSPYDENCSCSDFPSHSDCINTPNSLCTGTAPSDAGCSCADFPNHASCGGGSPTVFCDDPNNYSSDFCRCQKSPDNAGCTTRCTTDSNAIGCPDFCRLNPGHSLCGALCDINPSRPQCPGKIKDDTDCPNPGVSGCVEYATELDIEHVGLGIPKESASHAVANPTRFKASDQPIYLHFFAQDYSAADAGAGLDDASGVNFDDVNFHITSLVVKRKNSVFAAPQTDIFINPTIEKNGSYYKWNINKHRFTNETQPIFAVEGEYEIQLTIYDKAANYVYTKPLYIKILPADVHESTSFNTNCTEVNKVHAIEDFCDLNLKAFDPYFNPIAGRQISLTPTIQNKEGSYSFYEIGSEAVLANSIRFQNPAVTTASRSVYRGTTAADGTLNVKIRSLAPTGAILHGHDGAGLLVPSSVQAPFTIRAPKVNSRGDVIAAESILTKKEPLYFHAPLFVEISDKPAGAEVSNPWRPEFNQKLPVYVHVTKPPSGGAISQPNFDVYVKGHGDPAMKFQFYAGGVAKEQAGINETGARYKFTGVTEMSANQSNEFVLSFFGLLKSQLISFTSQIHYQPVGETGITVIYPGYVLGNNAGGNSVFDGDTTGAVGFDSGEIVEAMAIEADIEGQVVGQDFSAMDICDSAANDCINYSSIQQLATGSDQIDAREALSREVYSLLRGRSPDVDLSIMGDEFYHFGIDSDINLSTLENGGVTYFKGDALNPRFVRIGGGAKGAADKKVGQNVEGWNHTIVIEDANLLITDDLEYAHRSGSLGVVLINSTIEPEPEVGNIYVYYPVQELVGTYYADGSILSTTNPNPSTSLKPSAYEFLDPKNQTEIAENDKYQLVLEGTIFTKNTIGGTNREGIVYPWDKQLRDGQDKDGNALTEAEALGLAMRYDLHFLRRYKPMRNPSDSSLLMTKDLNHKCATLDNNANPALNQCYSNVHATVIIMDGKVLQNTPPGFEAADQFNLYR